MNKNALYVVYGIDYEGSYGHKYFSNKKQALDYKKIKEKTAEFDFDTYYIKEVKIEDESIDYSKIETFSVTSFEFCNYDSTDCTLSEDISYRKTRYFIDEKQYANYEKTPIELLGGLYDKPQLSIKYHVSNIDKNNVNDILHTINNLNTKILDRAIELCKEQIAKGKDEDYSCEYFVTNTLEAEFKSLVKKYLSV